MGMTSAAEAKLDARIRPEIAVMRSRTSYPKRRLAVAGAVAGEAGPPALDAETGHAADTSRPADTGRPAAADRSPATVCTARTGRPAETGTARAGRPVVAGSTAGTDRPAVAGGTARARTPAPARPIRLTRRGRIVVGVAVVVAALTAAGLLWLIVAGQARAANHTRPGVATVGRALTRVVVRPGQTLYSIAMAADPSADPRVIIREIVDQNALASTSIQVGQVLWVPRS